MQATFSPLAFFGVLRLTGADAAVFLHRQLSNHIEDLQNNQACAATYNTAKGRVIANVLVLHHNEQFLLIAAADLCETLLKRLKMFVLRSQVQIEAAPDWTVYGGTWHSNTAADALQYPITAHENGLIVPLSANNALMLQHQNTTNQADSTAQATWFVREIHAGRPWVSQATSELCVAQMLNQHQLGAVHFKKGCYPGQEIIARAQYRGQVKRGLVRTSSHEACQLGAIIHSDGEEVGWVINQAAENGHFSQLCVIKHSAAAVPLQANGIALQVAQTWFDNHDSTV